MAEQLTPKALDEPLPTSSQAPRLYMVGMLALAVIPILAIVGAFVLAWLDKAVPDMLGSLGTICATALAALFAYRKGQEAG
jgi:hypothetical protein